MNIIVIFNNAWNRTVISNVFKNIGGKNPENTASRIIDQIANSLDNNGVAILNPVSKGKINRKVLQNNGTTFFLKASIETLADRIHNTKKRPLLTVSENLQTRLEQIWKERKSFYRNSAHHMIDTDDLNPTQVLDEILNLLKVPLANH